MRLILLEHRFRVKSAAQLQPKSPFPVSQIKIGSIASAKLQAAYRGDSMHHTSRLDATAMEASLASASENSLH